MQLLTARFQHGKLYILLAILCAGVGIRGWQTTESLWLDELHTGWTVAGTWSDVSDRAAAGNQTPCYFWFIWIWRSYRYGRSLISKLNPMERNNKNQDSYLANISANLNFSLILIESGILNKISH